MLTSTLESQAANASNHKADQLRHASTLIEEHLNKDRWNFLKAEAFKALPDFMLQKYDGRTNRGSKDAALQVSSFMGIFPEINRVWMTIDNQLYLWNYESQEYAGTADPSDVINTHQDPDQIIVNVALVKPIPGVFLEQIEYLLVVSTPLEITLLGLAFSSKKKGDAPRGALSIYPTDMTCHADNVNMSSIVGTRHGRIFMRGNDGHLFELLYQAQDGWFTRKVRKVDKSRSSVSVFMPSVFHYIMGGDPIKMIQLDDERNILYTVTKRNHVELFSLGQDGTEFTSVAKFTNIADYLTRFNMFDEPIVSIHPISVSESNYLHCVAINASGFRLFFTTGSHPTQYGNSDSYRYTAPTTLSLQYVLAPAGLSVVNQAAKVHESFYSNGITVASQALEEVDRVMVFAPHAGTISQSSQKPMSEYASYHEIEGRTWAIAEATSNFLAVAKSDKKALGFTLNELATQFEFVSRRFYILTNGGLTTLVKLRPVDILLQLIHSCPPGDFRPFKEFFYSFGPDQSCAMTLAIACGHSSISHNQY
ncbi:hypothetical protein HDU91_005527, partial [Kappamyces sp. JEL0680]